MSKCQGDDNPCIRPNAKPKAAAAKSNCAPPSSGSTNIVSPSAVCSAKNTEPPTSRLGLDQASTHLRRIRDGSALASCLCRAYSEHGEALTPTTLRLLKEMIESIQHDAADVLSLLSEL